ncbi:HDOD domain-containing protein [Noviherbaspirillum suwonense]|jgi:HD-like signal output (HDOD) protein|uniref:HD-like signal output (HDOD) domain, no enzymatic activity n=1 Tax=Noviherbaspirillum suwonense TaxID=1224511 RepID=A0ABY1Q6M6_9BURK|nr:HDOD domain-containing protein [Noviherbaspirillum suwonense]SMP59791.1 HD-like signal output (HDOD) domain, no enzymatic activity [Noviherbaspirillum suwonense]
MTAMPPELGDSRKTQEMLWKQIKEQGHLPGFSNVVDQIVGAMQSEDEREFSMTRTVLSDPALTHRVLRLANSAMYAMFGEINTVSRAVMVLGTESIGHLALGLKLVDSLATVSSTSSGVRTEMEKAVLAGHIARQVTAQASTRDAEEAVVCSLLHGLGRMVVVFYLPQYFDAITKMVEEGVDEAVAAVKVLGMTMVDVGRLIARRWGLPRDLIESLHDVMPQAGEPLDHAGWLAALSTMSSSCARAICEDGAGDEALAVIVEGYSDMLGMECATVLEAVGAAREAARDDPALTRTAAAAASVVPEDIGRVDATPALVRGVADMRKVAASITTSQLMTMALETIFQNLKLTRAVAFLRNRKEGKYVAGMCFGADVQVLAPRLMFSDAYQPDVFHAALANDKMVCVKDASDPAFRAKLPRWWKDAFPAVRSFIVLPLTVNRHPVGFIYGDWDDTVPAALEQSEIVALNELRALTMARQSN